MKKVLCAREGCNKPVPVLALKQGDLHHSRVCFQLDYGTITVAEAAKLVKQ